MSTLSLFLWQKVFAHTISLELHVIVNLLLAREKKKKQQAKAICYGKAQDCLGNNCCICMALGFTSRGYWGTSIFKQNSLTYVEISLHPEDLNCSHHSLSLGKKTQTTTNHQVCVPVKQCARKYSVSQRNLP